MAKKVVENRLKTYIQMMIFTLIVTVIPVIIVAFTGFKSFTTVYGIYALSVLGIAIYFSVIIALFAWRNKALYIILDLINLIGGITFVVISYIFYTFQGGLLMHIATAFILTYGVFRLGDAKQGDNYIFRFFLPFLYLIGGLVFVLWFINVKVWVSVHVIFTLLGNGVAILFFLLPSFITSLKKGSEFYEDLQEDSLEYIDTTDEYDAKRAEKKAAKDTIKAERAEAKAAYKAEQEEFKKQKAEDIKSDAMWMADPNDVNHAINTILDAMNKTLEELDTYYRDANYRLRTGNSSFPEMDAFAVKAIYKDAKRLRNHSKKVVRNLKWVKRAKFKGRDQYTTFNYDPIRGSLIRDKRQSREPVFFVMGITKEYDINRTSDCTYYSGTVRFEPIRIELKRVR